MKISARMKVMESKQLLPGLFDPFSVSSEYQDPTENPPPAGNLSNNIRSTAVSNHSYADNGYRQMGGSLLRHADAPTYHTSEIFPDSEHAPSFPQEYQGSKSLKVPVNLSTSIPLQKSLSCSGTLYRKYKYVNRFIWTHYPQRGVLHLLIEAGRWEYMYNRKS
jgi:hypothetical protein